MAKEPTADLRDFLDSNISSLSSGVDLFDGPIREPSDDVPKEAVFITPNPGLVPLRDQAESSELKRTNVTVFVRSPRYGSGYPLLLDISTTIQGASISGYKDVFVVNSGPNFGQYTASGLLILSIIVQMSFEE